MPDLDALVPVIVVPTTAFALLMLTRQAMRFRARTTGNVASSPAEAAEPLIPIIYTTARTGTAMAAPRDRVARQRAPERP